MNLGLPRNEGLNGTLNVRNEKVNLFGTVNLSNSENSGTFFSETNYTRPVSYTHLTLPTKRIV